MKTCTRCRQELGQTAFGMDKSRPDGLHPVCRECKNRGAVSKIEPPPFRLCRVCKKRKPIAKFVRFKRRNDGRDTVCMFCRGRKSRARPRFAYWRGKIAERNRRVRIENKMLLIDRLGGKCAHCGIAPGDEWPILCFDFHHLDGADKTFNFARRMANVTELEMLVKEADRCIVLCATCHRRVHAYQEQGS